MLLCLLGLREPPLEFFTVLQAGSWWRWPCLLAGSGRPLQQAADISGKVFYIRRWKDKSHGGSGINNSRQASEQLTAGRLAEVLFDLRAPNKLEWCASRGVNISPSATVIRVQCSGSHDSLVVQGGQTGTLNRLMGLCHFGFVLHTLSEKKKGRRVALCSPQWAGGKDSSPPRGKSCCVVHSVADVISVCKKRDVSHHREKTGRGTERRLNE